MEGREFLEDINCDADLKGVDFDFKSKVKVIDYDNLELLVKNGYLDEEAICDIYAEGSVIKEDLIKIICNTDISADAIKDETLNYDELLELMEADAITEEDIAEMLEFANVEKEDIISLICEGKLSLEALGSEPIDYEELCQLIEKASISEKDIDKMYKDLRIEKEDVILLICERKLSLEILGYGSLDYDELYDLIDKSIISEIDIDIMLDDLRVKKEDVIKLICDDMLTMDALGKRLLDYDELYELVDSGAIDEVVLEKLLDEDRIYEDDIERLLDEGMIDDENLAYMY